MTALSSVVEQATWEPQPGPQAALLDCPITDVFFGGARGGGKSDGLLGDAARRAGKFAMAFRGVLFRRSFPDLEELIARSKELYTRVGWQYNANEHTWTTPAGGTLKFRYLDSDDDVQRYIGHQYSWLGIDQVEQFPRPEPLDKLWGSLRSPHGIPCVRRLTGNPPAPGWLKQRYIDPAPSGWQAFRYAPLAARPDYLIEAIYIPSRLEDNPLLLTKDPEYEQRLAAVSDPHLYRAWRHGDFHVMEGQVFGEWRHHVHVLPDFHAPKFWSWGAGLDWGYRAPGWFGLFACGPDGDVVCMDEVYFRETTATRAGYACGLMVRRYTADLPMIAADEQMWYKTGQSAPTLAEEFQLGLIEAFGGRLDLAPKVIEATHGRGSRAAKLAVLHEYLSWSPGRDGRVLRPPRLRFNETCKHAIRTIPSLPYDKRKPEDVDTDAEDHPYDGVTAFLMSRPAIAERPERQRDRDEHPGFDRAGRKRKQWQKAMERELAEHPSGGGYGIYTDFRVPRESELVPLPDE